VRDENGELKIEKLEKVFGVRFLFSGTVRIFFIAFYL